MATLQEYYNQLGSIYDPQTALIKQQQAQLPGQFQAEKSALEQARVNAFKDISNTASSRGMTFSGFNPQQQAIYVGEKFLPAMANLATAQQESQYSLIQALNKINSERSQTALGYYENAQQAEAANAAKIQAAQIAAQGNTANLRQAATSAISGALMQVRGRDGYVSPQDYLAARQDWMSQGFSAKDFDAYFSGFRNPYAEDIKRGKARSLADYGVF